MFRHSPEYLNTRETDGFQNLRDYIQLYHSHLIKWVHKSWKWRLEPWHFGVPNYETAHRLDTDVHWPGFNMETLHLHHKGNGRIMANLSISVMAFVDNCPLGISTLLQGLNFSRTWCFSSVERGTTLWSAPVARSDDLSVVLFDPFNQNISIV